jgi:hypothetical protein
MEIQRNAPNLSGAKPCPACQAPIARDAALCVHCGYDFATGQKARGPSRSWKKTAGFLLLAAGIGLLAWGAIQWLGSRRCAAPPAEPAAPPASVSRPNGPAEVPVSPERESFAAKKDLAEQAFRKKLDAQEPPFALNEPVELRRKNGLVDKGTLTGLAGTGTNRVALVATPTGEIGVPLDSLDNLSRRRVDAEFREAFIRHVLSTPNPAASGEQPEH